MSEIRIVGEFNQTQMEAWDELVTHHGSAFQYASVLQALESSTKGRFAPRHFMLSADGQLMAGIPAYLYDSCPRLDYYKRANMGAHIQDRILLSHHLIGWYGEPIARDESSMRQVVRAFSEEAEKEEAIAFFAGIDQRNEQTIRVLREEGYEIQRFQTIVVRSLEGIERDPTAALSHKRRGRVRNHLKHAYKNGARVRDAFVEDYDLIVKMIMGILEEDGVAPDVLPREFVYSLLNSPIPGLKVYIAVAPDDQVIGAKLYIRCGSIVYGMLSGHDRSLLKQYRQSHLLYDYGIRAAKDQGCVEIQAGRSPYEVKMTHGYRPVAILSAAKGATPEQHARTVEWVSYLAQRHRKQYGECFDESFWEIEGW